MKSFELRSWSQILSSEIGKILNLHDALNAITTVSLYTNITTTNTKITLGEVSAYKCGKLIFFTVVFTASSSLAGFESIITFGDGITMAVCQIFDNTTIKQKDAYSYVDSFRSINLYLLSESLPAGTYVIKGIVLMS